MYIRISGWHSVCYRWKNHLQSLASLIRSDCKTCKHLYRSGFSHQRRSLDVKNLKWLLISRVGMRYNDDEKMGTFKRAIYGTRVTEVVARNHGLKLLVLPIVCEYRSRGPVFLESGDSQAFLLATFFPTCTSQVRFRSWDLRDCNYVGPATYFFRFR
jgi:hypothetical protein